VRLRITDNGLGFDPRTEARGGFGLSSMRERARVAGGDLRLVSRPGAGTQIEVVLP
jgi:signal transduction histidine kinase